MQNKIDGYQTGCVVPMAMTAAQQGRELNDAIIALENITNRIVSDVMLNGLEDCPRVEPGNVLCSILENLNSRVRAVNNKLDRIESILTTQLDGVRLE